MTTETQPQTYPSVDAWREEGIRRFGSDQLRHAFVCPSCGHVATPQDWADVGAPSAVAFSCIGRWLPDCKEAFSKNGGPCNYAGGGLFAINPVQIAGIDVKFFAYAEPAQTVQAEAQV